MINDKYVIRCKNICKSFDENEVLKGVSLEISPDKITIIKGYSGCGKTTLMRCLLLLDPISSGNIFISGRPVEFSKKVEENAFNRNKFFPLISGVFQQLYLWPNLSCRKNIEIIKDNVDSNFSESYMLHLAERLGVIDILDHYPNQVSLGQKQRVAIIRALIFKPKILLLDEVTSALDAISTEKVASVLNELQDSGVSIFGITHSSEFSDQLNSAKIYTMDGGRVYEV